MLYRPSTDNLFGFTDRYHVLGGKVLVRLASNCCYYASPVLQGLSMVDRLVSLEVPKTPYRLVNVVDPSVITQETLQSWRSRSGILHGLWRCCSVSILSHLQFQQLSESHVLGLARTVSKLCRMCEARRTGPSWFCKIGIWGRLENWNERLDGYVHLLGYLSGRPSRILTSPVSPHAIT